MTTQNSLKLLFLGVIALSLGAIASVQLGLISPAHATTVNAAVRMLKASIAESEERIITEIQYQCKKGDQSHDQPHDQS